MTHAGRSQHDQLYAQITMPYYSTYLGLLAVYDNQFGANGGADDKVRCELAWSPDTKRWFRLRDQGRERRGGGADGRQELGAAHVAQLIPTGKGLGASRRVEPDELRGMCMCHVHAPCACDMCGRALIEIGQPLRRP